MCSLFTTHPRSSCLTIKNPAPTQEIKPCLLVNLNPVQEDTGSKSSSKSKSSKRTPKDGNGDFVSPQQRVLFSLFDSYADVFYAAKPYPGGPGWRPGQPDEAMDAVLLHVLNHCAKTADVIKKNNDKVKGAADAGEREFQPSLCAVCAQVGV